MIGDKFADNVRVGEVILVQRAGKAAPQRAIVQRIEQDDASTGIRFHLRFYGGGEAILLASPDDRIPSDGKPKRKKQTRRIL